MPQHLIFAYGTLKRGFERHHHLADQVFVSEVRTQPLYHMVNCGTYPGLLHADPGKSIEGELWRVSAACLDRLDEVEAVDELLYGREAVLLLPPHDQISVQGYFYLRDTSRMPDCGTRWA